MRKYFSGSKWAVWRWTYVNPEGGTAPYLVRLHLVKAPFGAVMLHWLNADPQPDMHDHPVSFLSVVLRGRYREETPAGWQGINWWNWKRATDRHRITRAAKGTLTLVFAGPKRREWGYHTTQGWVPWREYRY